LCVSQRIISCPVLRGELAPGIEGRLCSGIEIRQGRVVVMVQSTKVMPLLALALVFASCDAFARCPPDGFDRASLSALKTRQFEIGDDVRRNALAIALTNCLSVPDPELRDAIAFEALSHFLRAGQLSDATKLMLERRLRPSLTDDDARGFARPFAALALSEVARADRIKPYMSRQMRTDLLAAALAYFRGVHDYRGFDTREGWRHGVAHGADLLLQLSLNPAIGRAELQQILAALATQIAPEGHFYVYGEPERLARVVTAIAGRGLIDQTEWNEWFARVAAPAPWTEWSQAYSSQEGLARVHNLTAFVSRVFIAARLSGDEKVGVLVPGAEKALRSLP